MAVTARDRIVVAGRSLRLPDGVSAELLSDGRATAAVDKFVCASPDHTVYHRPPYIEFARRENGEADLVLLLSHGEPLAAVPFHPTRRGVSTGYAGVCFPPTASHSVLRRAVGTLAELSNLNPQLRLLAVQSAQAAASDDRARQDVLGWLIDGLPARQQRLHTRLLRMPWSSMQAAAAEATVETVEQRLMRGYDGDLRNQVRQAQRRGVVLRVIVPTNSDEAQAVYRSFASIHRASWQRTGMAPHPLGYLVGLEAAVRAGGGHDVIVLALDETGRPISAVNCHVYRDRAIYWSGCSLAEALPLRANPLGLHGAIVATHQRGARTFELGRFRADETDAKEISVTKYKAQFRGDVQRVLNFELGVPRVDVHALAHQLRARIRH
jgi:hypothetical protein